MATTGIMNGTLFVVNVDSTNIANSTDGTLSMSMETRDTTNKGSSGFRSILESTRSGTISTSALMEQGSGGKFENLFALFNGRTSCTVKFATSITDDKFYSATAYLTSLEMNAPTEDNVTYSATFELSGAITERTNS